MSLGAAIGTGDRRPGTRGEASSASNALKTWDAATTRSTQLQLPLLPRVPGPRSPVPTPHGIPAQELSR